MEETKVTKKDYVSPFVQTVAYEADAIHTSGGGTRMNWGDSWGESWGYDGGND